MASTYERSLLKGLVWEGFSFVVTLFALYFFYGDFTIALKFNILLTVVKIIFFFMHERIWKDIRWGKY